MVVSWLKKINAYLIIKNIMQDLQSNQLISVLKENKIRLDIDLNIKASSLTNQNILH